MISKIIWQTHEDSYINLDNNIKNLCDTWQKQNKGFEYKYYSASDRENFISENFGQEWLNIYKSCPIKTMQSNIWRYMVVYTYGGIYADTDTICHKPIEEWIDLSLDLVISVDHNDSSQYAQFMFASSKNNPFLLLVLKNIKKKFINGNINRDKTIMSASKLSYSYTGTSLWTESVNTFFNLNKNKASINAKFINNKTQKHNSICYTENDKHFNGEGMTHLASGDWSGGKYVAFGKNREIET